MWITSRPIVIIRKPDFRKGAPYMKHYHEPELEILRFQIKDILTTSDNDLPFIPYAAYDENEMELAEHKVS